MQITQRCFAGKQSFPYCGCGEHYKKKDAV
jgi:hypothetical protein